MPRYPRNPQTSSTPEVLHQAQQLQTFLKFHDISAPELARRLGKHSEGIVYHYIGRPQLSPKMQAALLGALGPSFAPFLDQLQAPAPHQGQQLWAFLDQHTILPTELARRLGRTKSTVWAYYRSQHMTPPLRAEIAGVLGVEQKTIFGLTPLALPDPAAVATPPASSLLAKLIERQQAD